MVDKCPCANWPPLGHEDPFVCPFGISVFFPAYNDAPSLPALLARTFETLGRHAVDYEVIVINDGSRDNTSAVLEDLRREYSPHLRVITHEENRGYGGALRSGFANATKEFVFYTDGDGQYDPAELLTLLRKMAPDVGLVNGYKIARQDPWRRVVIGWVYNRLARFLFRVKLRDIDCDFRLIRKSVLDQLQLSSTSGTICVELVRKIEVLAPKVVEAPVHHYPRLHGVSQFFRVRSLATTFLQLCGLFCRLVLLQSPAATALPVMLLVAVLCALAYGRSLIIPFIADDYLQIQLARDYGPFSGWPSLARDVLYRCRATSLVLTYWTERLFGLDATAFSISSLALHIVNSWLVFALGSWHLIGWRVSAIAACYFAVCQQHQEAVIWYAALPELLVFFFAIVAFLCWVQWLQDARRAWKWFAGALISFLLALLSKESAVAVVALMAMATLIQDRGRLKRLPWLGPFAVLSGIYFALAFVARENHQHFNDGTFSLGASFLMVIARSTLRLFAIWPTLGLAALIFWRDWKWKTLLQIAGAWIAIAFFPYSFLTYMPYVPSRHTYLASAGVALVIAAAALAFAERSRKRFWAVWALATMLVTHHCVYLWTKKHQQFVERAAPTERLIQFAGKTDGAVYIRCFPYHKSIAELAVGLRIDADVRPALVFSGKEGPAAAAIDLCTKPAENR
jgi:glycosyltransferase involved in cell wall biosynthesis